MARDVLTKNEQATQMSRVGVASRKSPLPTNRQSPVLQLHRLVGNRAVQRMMGTSALQTKPQTPQETSQEAEAPDRSQAEGPLGSHLLHGSACPPRDSGSQTPHAGHALIGRKPSGVMHPLLASLVQTKLQVSQPGDPYEREADEVADEVMAQRQVTTISRLSTGGLLRTSQDESKEEEGFLQPTSMQQQERDEEEAIQPYAKVDRLPESEEDPQLIQAKRLLCKSNNRGEVSSATESVPILGREKGIDFAHQALQRASISIEAEKPSNKIEATINSMAGSGQSLPNADRAFFEQRMGANFSNVRIHSNTKASETSQSINARAFTFGNNIAFNNGEYRPGTTEGRRLLAHELTHVVQQNAADTLQRKSSQDSSGGPCPNCGAVGNGPCQACSQGIGRIQRKVASYNLAPPTVSRPAAKEKKDVVVPSTKEVTPKGHPENQRSGPVIPTRNYRPPNNQIVKLANRTKAKMSSPPGKDVQQAMGNRRLSHKQEIRRQNLTQLVPTLGKGKKTSPASARVVTKKEFLESNGGSNSILPRPQKGAQKPLPDATPLIKRTADLGQGFREQKEKTHAINFSAIDPIDALSVMQEYLAAQPHGPSVPPPVKAVSGQPKTPMVDAPKARSNAADGPNGKPPAINGSLKAKPKQSDLAGQPKKPIEREAGNQEKALPPHQEFGTGDSKKIEGDTGTRVPPKATISQPLPASKTNGNLQTSSSKELPLETASQDSTTADLTLTARQPSDDQFSEEITTSKMRIQRDVIDMEDVIPDWVTSALNGLRGDSTKKENQLSSDATGKKDDLDSHSTTKGADIQGYGETKGNEIETQGQAKGDEVNTESFGRMTELQGVQISKSQELRTDQLIRTQELQTNASEKDQELQQHQVNKQADLQTQQQTKVKELEAQASTKESELQTQTQTKEAELQSDAETKSDELTGYWTNTKTEAERQKEDLFTRMNTEIVTIEQEGLTAKALVQNQWTILEGNAGKTIQDLDSEAGELCKRYQGKAQEYLAFFDPIIEKSQEKWKKLKNAAMKEWDSLMKKAEPLLKAISETWETFSTWAGEEVWNPLKKKAGELASYVGKKVGEAWEWGKKQWTWLNERGSEAKEWLLSRGDAAREWIGEKADSARQWIEDKAGAANDWIANKAETARDWIDSKANAAEEWVANKAEGARAWIGEKADGALNWITGKADVAREWVSGKANAANTWINQTSSTAREWIKGKADGVTNWLKDTGQGLVSGISKTARSAVSTISEHGGPITKWFGGVVNSLISSVESVGNRAVTGVTDAMNFGLNFVESKVSSAVGFVGDKATGAVNWVETTSSQALNLLETTGVTAVNVLHDTATHVTNGVATTASGTVNLVKQGSARAVNGLEHTAHSGVSFVRNSALETVSKLEQTGNTAVDGVEAVAKAAGAFVKVIWEGHKTVWGGLWEGTKWYYSTLWDKSIQFGKWMWDDFIKPSTKWVEEKWNSLKDWVQKTFPGLTACWKLFQEYADATWEKIKQLPLVSTIVDIHNTIIEIRSQILEGALKGDLIDDPTGWNIVGQVLIGFVPYAGQAADVRDLLVAIDKVKKGEPGAWLNLSLNIVAFVPGIGDAFKAGKGLKHADEVADAAKGTNKVLKETAPEAIDAAKAGSKSLDEAAEAAKAGTKSIDEAGDTAKAGSKSTDEATDAAKAGEDGKKADAHAAQEDAAGYAAAVLALKSFTQAQDIRNASIPELIGELNLLKRRFPTTKNRDITASQNSPGHYKIVMREVLDQDYTPTGPEPRTPGAKKFIEDYKSQNPGTKYTDDELEQFYRDGYTINPETKRLNKPSNDLGFDSTTPDMRARVQGNGYLDPIDNKFKPAPAGEIMSPDHIVPVKRIKEMDGFDDLTTEQKRAIIHDTDGIGNIQALPKSMNESKGGRSAGDWKMYGDKPINKEYSRNLKKEQDRLEREIQKQIDRYLAEKNSAVGG